MTNTMEILTNHILISRLSLALLISICTGCVNKIRMTEPTRSLGEQLLISTSIDRSLSLLDPEAIGRLKGFKVFISSTYIKTLDQEYLVGSLRDILLSNGALVVDESENADMIVEVRSGANSLDTSNATLGISEDQSLPNPVTGAPVALPEIAFYKKENNLASTKLAIVAYKAKSREHVFSSGTLLGGAFDKHFQVLGIIRFRFTDVPELRALKQLNRRYR
ncbi:MAG: hypothetical protein CMO77_07465 [Verrucomicrobiales bacterium]|nr:hypothetical protein [Verrucomicrobiales bacterium]